MFFCLPMLDCFAATVVLFLSYGEAGGRSFKKPVGRDLTKRFRRTIGECVRLESDRLSLVKEVRTEEIRSTKLWREGP